MKNLNVFICSLLLFVAFTVSKEVQADDSKQIPLDSLIGQYDGRMQVHSGRFSEFNYQIEIVSIDKSANTVSLTAHCQDCETKEIKRNNCAITEAKENIKFVCKKKSSDELYTFNGSALEVKGIGNKFPYTINVTKVVKK
ncbi:MAG: hypothetical protein GJV46_03045 [Geobacter sp.]|nr:hypothetical protein [Geobacter sp.]